MRKITILLIIVVVIVFGFLYLLTTETTGTIQQKVLKIVRRLGEEKTTGNMVLSEHALQAKDRALLMRLVDNIWLDLNSLDKSEAALNVTPKESETVQKGSAKKDNELITKKDQGYIISVGAFSTYENARKASERFKDYATRIVKSTREEYFFLILNKVFTTRNDVISFQKKLSKEGIKNVIKPNKWSL